MITILIASIFLYTSCLEKVMAFETIYIRANGSVEPYYAPIQRTGNVYTLTSDISSDIDGIVIEKNDTVLNGAGHRLQGMNVQFSKGIYLSGDSNVTIRNTTITSFENGILLDSYSVNNLIVDNRLEGNDYGVSCWAFSDNNIIIGNNMTANNLAGIWIVGSSYNNISENMIAGNNQYGISLESSSNNSIYHNKFVDNTNQIYIYDSTNSWDNGYPSGGNYWSDYNGTDANGDFFGDTPYIIDQDNIDRYPFMYIYWNPADINQDLKVDIKDISTAAKAFGTVPGNAFWNPRADITGPIPLVPDGKVDIRDVSLIARNFGKKYQ